MCLSVLILSNPTGPESDKKGLLTQRVITSLLRIAATRCFQKQRVETTNENLPFGNALLSEGCRPVCCKER